MLRDLTLPAITMGLLAAFVGYAASFAIVLAGLGAMGASPGQAATGLFFATLGMGMGSMLLPAMTRIPAAVAWSTPGAAMLAASAAPDGGFAVAVGAMLICAAMIVITGFVPALGRLVAAIPKPVANALLAGVLLKLCFAPAVALGSVPLLVLPVLMAWLAGLCWHRLAAMPCAVAAFAAVMAFGVDLGGGAMTWQLPALVSVMPVFDPAAMVSLALPLFLVTMAGQNVPGFAVLDLNGYTVPRAALLRGTGGLSLLIAPFGAVPVNMSAITAAIMAGEDAGRDPSRRYWAAIVSGLAYVALALAAGSVAAIAARAPADLITAVAGLALIPALVGSLSGAFADRAQPEAPALTFLIAASGMGLWGVSGAFWAVVAGVTVWVARAAVRRG
ncbi:benzoate/H(+) symporter BenE family transporter [Jannaschia sp. 2305UL9-9]|uniref:benzoate/H(+) symporter BenE family transporter n=1 Tax=Jannaschia sp. 2305UL9-9 TaxID=3121638 RepID=UPI003528B653